MKIKVDLKIFLIIILFFVTKQIEIYSIFMIFICIHELAHMLAGILCGLKLQRIEIMPVGISIQFMTGSKKNAAKIIIPLAGPLCNFIISVIVLLFKESVIRNYIIYSNIIIGLFNLIPIYPLDGGRILKAVLHIINEKYNISEIVNKVSNVTTILLTIIASIVIIYYKNISILIAIASLWIIMISENRKYKIKLRITRIIENDRKIRSQKVEQ